ncbi:hypothetical protein ISS07_01465 [Candidatus Woesearchaeota archaeon]|nr:hypothetical protein [Candidatus Woesearchaeota archaeon]
MKKDKGKKFEIEKVQIKDISPKVEIILSFSFPSLLNLEKFEQECEKRKLPVKVDKETSIKGTVFVSCSHFDLKNNLMDIRTKLGEPIKLAVKNTNFREEIKKSIVKSKYFHSVIGFIQDKFLEYKQNKVTKEQVEDDTFVKYGHLLGKEGAKRVAHLFDKNPKNIVSNYVVLQDYLIKHYSIEFFIEQQIKNNYYLIITIKENGVPLSHHKRLSLIEKNSQIYEKKPISVPGISKQENLYIPEKDRNSIVILNPRRDNYRFVHKLLDLKQVNGAILFINFLLDKQAEGLKIDIQQFGYDIDKIKSAILRYDTGGIDKTLDKIERLEEIILNLREEFLLKIKRYCDEIDFEKKGIEKETLERVFNQTKRAGGEVIGVEKFNPPEWLSSYLFIEDFKEFKQKVYSLHENLQNLLESIRKLKEHIVEYRHKVDMREQDKADKLRNSILESLDKVIKIIKTIFGG